jgi:hypothetical protein
MEIFSYKSRPLEVTCIGDDGRIHDYHNRKRITTRQDNFKQLPRNKFPHLSDQRCETRQPCCRYPYRDIHVWKVKLNLITPIPARFSLKSEAMNEE